MRRWNLTDGANVCPSFGGLARSYAVGRAVVRSLEDARSLTLQVAKTGGRREMRGHGSGTRFERWIDGESAIRDTVYRG